MKTKYRLVMRWLFPPPPSSSFLSISSCADSYKSTYNIIINCDYSPYSQKEPTLETLVFICAETGANSGVGERTIITSDTMWNNKHWNLLKSILFETLLFVKWTNSKSFSRLYSHLLSYSECEYKQNKKKPNEKCVREIYSP